MIWLVLTAIAALVLAPPKYDPAIRLKEWLMKRRRRKDRRHE